MTLRESVPYYDLFPDPEQADSAAAVTDPQATTEAPAAETPEQSAAQTSEAGEPTGTVTEQGPADLQPASPATSAESAFPMLDRQPRHHMSTRGKWLVGGTAVAVLVAGATGVAFAASGGKQHNIGTSSATNGQPGSTNISFGPGVIPGGAEATPSDTTSVTTPAPGVKLAPIETDPDSTVSTEGAIRVDQIHPHLPQYKVSLDGATSVVLQPLLRDGSRYGNDKEYVNSLNDTTAEVMKTYAYLLSADTTNPDVARDWNAALLRFTDDSDLQAQISAENAQIVGNYPGCHIEFFTVDPTDTSQLAADADNNIIFQAGDVYMRIVKNGADDGADGSKDKATFTIDNAAPVTFRYTMLVNKKLNPDGSLGVTVKGVMAIVSTNNGTNLFYVGPNGWFPGFPDDTNTDVNSAGN